MKNYFKDLVDRFMPIDEEIDDYEEVEQNATVTKSSGRTSRVEVVREANGGEIQYTVPEQVDNVVSMASRQNETVLRQPHLTVHETKVPSLKVQIYTPSEFNDVRQIADDFKSGRAILINYEKVAPDLQRRICDFINGVCYVIDGSGKKVTGQIMLYTPKGVEIDDTMGEALKK